MRLRIRHRLSNQFRSLALAAALGAAMLTWGLGVQVNAEQFHRPGPSSGVRDGHPRMRAGELFTQLVILVISSLIQYALAPKPPKPKPAALEDFDMPQAVQGAPFAMIFGEALDESPTVAWFGELTPRPIKKGKK